MLPYLFFSSAQPILLVLLALLHVLPPALAQPIAYFTFFRTVLDSTPFVYTTDGGRTYSTSLAPDGGSWSFGMASNTGGTTLVFSYVTGGSFTLQQWLTTTDSWMTYSSGLPTTLTSIYAGDVSLTRSAWLVGLDAGGVSHLFTWTWGKVPFYEVPLGGTCASTGLGVMSALPSTNLWVAQTEAPFTLSLFAADTGCLGGTTSVSVVGGTQQQVWSMATTFVNTTTYKVLMAVGPIGCGGGGAGGCPSSPTGGFIFGASVTSTGGGDSILLSPSSWSSFPVPAGGGVNLVGCYYSVSGRSYCYAAATWQPPGYAGVCASGTTGYPIYTAGSHDPTLSSSWTAVGCIPALPQSMAIVDSGTVHVAGLTLAGTSSSVVYSADAGVSWRTLTTLPSTVVLGGSSTLPPLLALPMATRGGPVIISGTDPANHCSTSAASFAATCTSASISGTCASVLKIATTVMGYGRRGVAGSAAYLGTYVPSIGAVSGNSYVSWVTQVCNGWSGSWYSNVYAITPTPYKWGGTMSAFFTALAWGDVNPRMIYVSEVIRAANGILQVDIDVLAAHGEQLARFVNTGGGLYVAGFQGPSGSVNLVNYGFLAGLNTSVLAPKTVVAPNLDINSGPAMFITPDGASLFPTLTAAEIISPWHTAFGGVGYGNCDTRATPCTFGVLSCIAAEAISPNSPYTGAQRSCAIVGGSSIAFNYGVSPQNITCTPFWPPVTRGDGGWETLYALIICSATSGLPPLLTLTTPSTCTLTSSPFPGTFSIGYVNSTLASSTGPCTVKLSQSGDVAYAPAATVTLTTILLPTSFSPRPSPSPTLSPTLTPSVSLRRGGTGSAAGPTPTPFQPTSSGEPSAPASPSVSPSASSSYTPSGSPSPPFSSFSASFSVSSSPLPSDSPTSNPTPSSFPSPSATVAVPSGSSTPLITPMPSPSSSSSVSTSSTPKASLSPSGSVSTSTTPDSSTSLFASMSTSTTPDASPSLHASVSTSSCPSQSQDSIASLTPSLGVGSTQTSTPSVTPTPYMASLSAASSPSISAYASVTSSGGVSTPSPCPSTSSSITASPLTSAITSASVSPTPENASPSSYVTPSLSSTPSPFPTPVASETGTPSLALGQTSCPSTSRTPFPSPTPTATNAEPTPSLGGSSSLYSSPTSSLSPSITPSGMQPTLSGTPSVSLTFSSLPTPTLSSSSKPSISPQSSPTLTSSGVISDFPTLSNTLTPDASLSIVSSVKSSLTPSASPSLSSSPSYSISPSISLSPLLSPSILISPSSVATFISFTSTTLRTPQPSITALPTPSLFPTLSITPLTTPTPRDGMGSGTTAPTQSPSASISASITTDPTLSLFPTATPSTSPSISQTLPWSTGSSQLSPSLGGGTPSSFQSLSATVQPTLSPASTQTLSFTAQSTLSLASTLSLSSSDQSTPSLASTLSLSASVQSTPSLASTLTLSSSAQPTPSLASTLSHSASVQPTPSIGNPTVSLNGMSLSTPSWIGGATPSPTPRFTLTRTTTPLGGGTQTVFRPTLSSRGTLRPTTSSGFTLSLGASSSTSPSISLSTSAFLTPTPGGDVGNAKGTLTGSPSSLASFSFISTSSPNYLGGGSPTSFPSTTLSSLATLSHSLTQTWSVCVSSSTTTTSSSSHSTHPSPSGENDDALGGRGGGTPSSLPSPSPPTLSSPSPGGGNTPTPSPSLSPSVSASFIGTATNFPTGTAGGPGLKGGSGSALATSSMSPSTTPTPSPPGPTLSASPSTTTTPSTLPTPTSSSSSTFSSSPSQTLSGSPHPTSTSTTSPSISPSSGADLLTKGDGKGGSASSIPTPSPLKGATPSPPLNRGVTRSSSPSPSLLSSPSSSSRPTFSNGKSTRSLQGASTRTITGSAMGTGCSTSTPTVIPPTPSSSPTLSPPTLSTPSASPLPSNPLNTITVTPSTSFLRSQIPTSTPNGEGLASTYSPSPSTTSSSLASASLLAFTTPTSTSSSSIGRGGTSTPLLLTPSTSPTTQAISEGKGGGSTSTPTSSLISLSTPTHGDATFTTGATPSPKPSASLDDMRGVRVGLSTPTPSTTGGTSGTTPSPIGVGVTRTSTPSGSMSPLRTLTPGLPSGTRTPIITLPPTPFTSTPTLTAVVGQGGTSSPFLSTPTPKNPKVLAQGGSLSSTPSPSSSQPLSTYTPTSTPWSPSVSFLPPTPLSPTPTLTALDGSFSVCASSSGSASAFFGTPSFNFGGASLSPTFTPSHFATYSPSSTLPPLPSVSPSPSATASSSPAAAAAAPAPSLSLLPINATSVTTTTISTQGSEVVVFLSQGGTASLLPLLALLTLFLLFLVMARVRRRKGGVSDKGLVKNARVEQLAQTRALGRVKRPAPVMAWEGGSEDRGSMSFLGRGGGGGKGGGGGITNTFPLFSSPPPLSSQRHLSSSAPYWTANPLGGGSGRGSTPRFQSPPLRVAFNRDDHKSFLSFKQVHSAATLFSERKTRL